jgi:hypothetical protein
MVTLMAVVDFQLQWYIVVLLTYCDLLVQLTAIDKWKENTNKSQYITCTAMYQCKAEPISHNM